jgi:hypothetical protein
MRTGTCKYHTLLGKGLENLQNFVSVGALEQILCGTCLMSLSWLTLFLYTPGSLLSSAVPILGLHNGLHVFVPSSETHGVYVDIS